MGTQGFLRRDFEVFAIKDIDARLAKIDGGDPSWPRAIARAGEIDRITLKAQCFCGRLSLGCIQNRNQVDDNLTAELVTLRTQASK